jgi:hypothetical protein
VLFERHDTRKVVFESAWADAIVREHASVLERHFVVVEPGRARKAVIFFNGRRAGVVPAGKRALFWRGPVKVTAKLVTARRAPARKAFTGA